MPAEEQAAQAAGEMLKGAVQLVIETSAWVLSRLSQITGKPIRNMELPDKRKKQSTKRLQYVARKEGTSVEQIPLEGMDKNDPRFKQIEKYMKQQGIGFSLDTADGRSFVSFMARDEQLALNAAERAGIALGGKLVNQTELPAEKLARAEAQNKIKPRTAEQKKAEPVLTLNVRTRPYDTRAGIIRQNLDRLGIKNIVSDEGYRTRITIRQGDAAAAKTMIDSLSDNTTVNHFDISRVENYNDLEKAVQQTTPVQEQDQQLAGLLSEQEAQPQPQQEETQPKPAETTPDAPAQTTTGEPEQKPEGPDLNSPATEKQLGYIHSLEEKGVISGQEAAEVKTIGDANTVLNRHVEYLKLDRNIATRASQKQPGKLTFTRGMFGQSNVRKADEIARQAKEQTREITHSIKQEGPAR